MSLLPDTILVKRKRDHCDAALDFLCFEDYGNKRHKSEGPSSNCASSSSASTAAGWVFQCRKETDVESVEHIAPIWNEQDNINNVVAAPSQGLSLELSILHASNTADDEPPIKAICKRKSATNVTAKPTINASIIPTASVALPAILEDANHNLRRLHLSWISESGPGVVSAAVSMYKKRSSMFFERDGVIKRTQKRPKHEIAIEKPFEVFKAKQSQSMVNKTSKSEPNLISAPDLVRNKRPGARSRIRAHEPILPPSLLHRGNFDPDQLARDMNAFSFAQSTQNVAYNDQKQKEQEKRTRYQPKALGSGQRFFERNPDYATRRTVNGDDDMDMSTSDNDFVWETYVRVPASRLTNGNAAPDKVGFLVFDSKPDRLEFFFGTEHDSEEDFFEDEEDENTENHYSADYPDEDLEWDDELDYDAYKYRMGNDFDVEEHGIDDFGFEPVVVSVWDEAERGMTGQFI